MAEKLSIERDYDGMVREVFEEDGAIITKRTFDVEPLKNLMAEERAHSAGRKYGEVHKLGTIPPHVYAQMIKDGRAKNPAAMVKWLEENPVFKSIDKKYAL